MLFSLQGLTDDTLYTWDFGDGVSVSGVGLQDYGVQTHSYDKEGTYTVVVTASNENGASTVSLTISIGGELYSVHFAQLELRL